MILSIVKEPNKILRHKAKPVSSMTPEILRLIDDMIETMHAAEGVGLAANQVGSDLHLLVATPDGKPGNELILVNARLASKRGTASSPEGCLSLPGISAEVARAAEITVWGLDRDGKPRTIRATGLLAKIFQHEIDHLEGRLYVDQLAQEEKQELLEKYRKISETLGRVQL